MSGKLNLSAIAPSNIALVKYWGKRDVQIPLNPSLSLSLSKAQTRMDLSLERADSFSFDFYFEGKPKPSFNPKLQIFFELTKTDLPFLQNYKLKIESSNTFPHSTGIASSASAFAALSLALVGLEFMLKKSVGEKVNADEENLKQKASKLARLGSGSACRSLEGGFNSWGEKSLEHASKEIHHSIFNHLQDTILIVDREPKKVSSSEGHSLMFDHPYREARVKQAHDHYQKISKALISGDLKSFCDITISEALSLHAMMLTSSTPYLLLKPKSVELIELLLEFKKSSGIDFTFTLDAGPNIHLLSLAKDQQAIQYFINHEIAPLLKVQGEIMHDEMGEGAKILWK